MAGIADRKRGIMFLKIVHYPEEANEPQIHERMIECTDYLFSYYPDGQRVRIETMKDDLTVDRTMEITCEKTIVYVMSGIGRTIDSYKWRKTDGILKRI